MELTPEQISELSRLKQYFPYRIVYGAVDNNGAFTASVVSSMRIPNKLTREGSTVFIYGGNNG